MSRLLTISIITIAVGLAAISRQSFWIDEGGTMIRSMMPTLGQWWHILQIKGSDIQMPLYMLYAWFWHQHLGAVSEYALRLSNLPWLILTVLVLARVRYWPLVCLLSPFVLYFVNDFRPYSMQIAAGACAAAALARVMEAAPEKRHQGVHAVCAACVFLILCSLTSAVWAAAVALGALIVKPGWLRDRGFWLRAAPWLAVALAAGAFYGYTLMLGLRATEIPDAGILNVLFGVYEMMGLLGLGPGKDELRRSVAAVVPHLWLLIPAALCIAGAWWCGFQDWARRTERRNVVAAACVVMLPLLTLAVVGMLMDFRVLGRHLSPVLPAVLLPIANAFQVTGRMRKVSFTLAGASCILMLASNLGVRLLERHAKDDFRRATRLAIKALSESKRVWWQADMGTACYYAYRQGGIPMLNSIQMLASDPPSGWMFADVVFINRPDLRYRNTDYQAELKQNFFRLDQKFTGFEVWVAE